MATAVKKKDPIPFVKEIRNFRTMNQKNSPITMGEDELPICQNLMPIGSALWTVPGYSEVKASIGSSETAWAATTAMALDDIRRPTVANGCIYKISARAGTFKTGANEPAWPTTQDTTIVDNEVTWKCYRLDILRAFDFNLAGVIYKIVVCGGTTTDSVTLYKLASSTNWAQTRINIPGKSGQNFTNPRMEQWKNTHTVIQDTMGGYFNYDGTTLTLVDGTHLGTDIAVFDGRVWTVNGLTIQYSAIGSITDFSVAGGGGSIVDSNPDTRISIQKLAATAGYLYAVGDHATHSIFGAQVFASGNVAYTLADNVPGIGTLYPETVKVLGGSVAMMGDYGMNLISGQSFTPFSELLDSLYPKIQTSFTPVACFAKIYNKYVYCVLVNVTNPSSGNNEKLLLCTYEGRWFIVRYGLDLTYIQQTATASDTQTYGAYANNIVQLFSGTSTVMQRQVRTKAMDYGQPQHDKQILNVGAMLESLTGIASSMTATITAICDNTSYPAQATFTPAAIVVTNNVGATVSVVNGSSVAVSIVTAYSSMLGITESPGGRGKRISLDFFDNSANQYIISGLYTEGQLGGEW